MREAAALDGIGLTVLGGGESWHGWCVAARPAG